jgi:hypothetical protein
MKDPVFGATGRPGSRVLSEGPPAGRGFRTPEPRDGAKTRSRQGVELVEGDTGSEVDVRGAAEGTAAVLCCLGMGDISLPTKELSDSVTSIFPAMQEVGVSPVQAIGSAALLAQAAGSNQTADVALGPYTCRAAEHGRITSRCGLGPGQDPHVPGHITGGPPARAGNSQRERAPSGSAEIGNLDFARAAFEMVPAAESHGKRVGIASFR